MNHRDLAFVLHTRPYRETSQLVTLFSRCFGRFNAVGKGSRGSRNGNVVQPFVPLQIEWRGKTDLKTLVLADPVTPAARITGNLIYIGLYINELLMRVLQEQDPLEGLFQRYENLLVALPQCSDVELLLRSFELGLLQELGYGLQMEATIDSGEPLLPDGYYLFTAGEGFVRSLDTCSNNNLFRGDHLLSMLRGEMADPLCRLSAKRLTRLALRPHIGERPLVSRSFFRKEPSPGGFSS